MNTNIITIVLLLVVLLLAVSQTITLASMDDARTGRLVSMESPGSRVAGAANEQETGSGTPLPSNLQNLPDMVGGC